MSNYEPRDGVDARTRDGRRATNIRRIDDPIYPFEGDIDGRTLSWTETGNYWFGTEGGAVDLVADWEEPVSPAPSAGPVRIATRPEIERLRRALVVARKHLALLGGDASDDPYADAIQNAVLGVVDQAIADAMEQESKL